MADIIKILARELQIKENQVQATIELIDAGNTIPFIARYRKEVTGSLDDEVLRNLDERLKYLRNLEDKKEQILSTIDELGQLDEALKKRIHEAMTLVALEDIYRPYKPKKKTRATLAIQKGLEPLATLLWEERLTKPALEEAKSYLSDKEGVEVLTEKEALLGALDIVAEWISDDADIRELLREKTIKQGLLISEAKSPGESSVYENYYHFVESITKLAGYKVLALNRGESEKILQVKVDAPVEEIERLLFVRVIKKNNPYCRESLEFACVDAYKRLIAPSIERGIRTMLTEKAQEEAIKVFGKNLTQLLMQPPIVGKTVLGWDPAFRTGCKLAVVDATGKVLDTTVIYPTAPQNRVEESKKILKAWIKKYHIDMISLGNGTASRESETVITELIKEMDIPLEYVIVNEAGASVYSASKLASEEFPEFDVGQRSATSIARRVQDPLAELVKIDPKSIGVGQYQHDMNQKQLDEALGAVVEDCVNHVGVDLNTASPSLLSYISGISKTTAKNIVAYRESHGSFRNRRQLLKVNKLGSKAFEQCAGFLRITDGEEILDRTSVHPESYGAVRTLLTKLGLELEEIATGGLKNIRKKVTDVQSIALELGVGVPTLVDILGELEKPARDPREDMPKPILRKDVLELEDLKVGMILKGTVRNVIDFGAFVDIGVHQDGLVHISRMSKKYIKHPLDIVRVGDIVEVKVLEIDVAKKRIGLSMNLD